MVQRAKDLVTAGTAAARALGWKRWLSAAIAGAAVVYLAFAVDLATAIVAAIGVAAAWFTVHNPYAARPKPQLRFELDGEPATRVVLRGPPRLDVDALVAEAAAEARSAAPTRGVPPGARWRRYWPPTDEDHDEFDKMVAEYEESYRKWLAGVTVSRDRAARTFTSRVLAQNPSTVDAQDAGLVVRFPPKFEPVEDEPAGVLLPPPDPPLFPLKAMGAARLEELLAGHDARISHPRVTPIGFGDLGGAIRDPFDPEWERRNTGVELRYAQRGIRHGETEPAGHEFTVVVPAGRHTVAWRVHAENLPQAAQGTWDLEYRPSRDVDPVATHEELDADLRSLGLGIRADDER